MIDKRMFYSVRPLVMIALLAACTGCSSDRPSDQTDKSRDAKPTATGPESTPETPRQTTSAPATTDQPATRTDSAATEAPTSVLGNDTVTAVGTGTFDRELAKLKIPPDWFDSVEIHYDTNKPWKDARLEIRRLLSLGGEQSKEAMKLTVLYREKKDIGDGHEYPMYLFMGGEIVWATKAYIDFTNRLLADPNSYEHIHAFLCLASCYAHFYEFDKALDTLNTAMKRLPDPPWRIARQAEIHNGLGDVYAAMGQTDKARQHYSESIRLYPTSKQPYGRHLLKRQAEKVQSKLDLLDMQSLKTATLRDGTYRVKTLGYSGDKDMYVTVVIQSGQIADIQVEHAEKIEQGATQIIPQRIIASQSLNVDGITGATVTTDAIIDGVFRALKQSGL